MTSLLFINKLRASVLPADPEVRYDPDRLWYLTMLANPIPPVCGDLRPTARRLSGLEVWSELEWAGFAGCALCSLLREADLRPTAHRLRNMVFSTENPMGRYTLIKHLWDY